MHRSWIEFVAALFFLRDFVRPSYNSSFQERERLQRQKDAAKHILPLLKEKPGFPTNSFYQKSLFLYILPFCNSSAGPPPAAGDLAAAECLGK